MGLRYDRNMKRATNGPMIFFSDPFSDVTLDEEIKGAIESQLSFYAYRYPGDKLISFGSSETVIVNKLAPGFVIFPFRPDQPFFVIPYHPESHIEVEPVADNGTFPDKSTPKEEYIREVKSIKEAISQKEVEKVVASRIILKDFDINPGYVFGNLCRQHPDAFVFCFGTPHTGCWIGASPELLLKGTEGNISTMSLAGTRTAGKEGKWDEKNIEEQRIVTDYITKLFENNDFLPQVEEPQIKHAGRVEHICTMINGKPTAEFSTMQFQGLLKDLSPTPALCGFPKNKALKIIEKCENFNRDFYGGFCGPFHSISDFIFHVVLRCAQFKSNRLAIYCGGGITLKSKEEEEWEETVLKASTILDSIKPPQSIFISEEEE